MALVLFIALACKDFDSETSTKSQIDVNQLIILKSEKDIDSQKQLYTELNQYEKNFIWKERITTFISNNSLTTQQENHLKSLVDMLSSELFESKNVVKIREIEKKWTPMAFTLFNKDELRELLGGLNKETLKKSNTRDGKARVSASGCGCNGDSMFDCAGCNAQDACQSSGSGCGFLWGYSCSKSCYIPPVNEK